MGGGYMNTFTRPCKLALCRPNPFLTLALIIQGTASEDSGGSQICEFTSSRHFYLVLMTVCSWHQREWDARWETTPVHVLYQSIGPKKVEVKSESSATNNMVLLFDPPAGCYWIFKLCFLSIVVNGVTARLTQMGDTQGLEKGTTIY